MKLASSRLQLKSDVHDRIEKKYSVDQNNMVRQKIITALLPTNLPTN